MCSAALVNEREKEREKMRWRENEKITKNVNRPLVKRKTRIFIITEF